MLATAAKLSLAAAAALALFATSADAQRIHPRCVKAKDPVRCTCGRETGAVRRYIPGRGWRLMLREGRDAVNERYIACMRSCGRA